MRTAAVFLVVLFTSLCAAAATPVEDAERYVQIFNGDPKLHANAVESLAWMGISDTRVFDILEKRVRDELNAARDDRNEKNRVARYIRALGFSGQTKYADTLRSLTKDRDYGRYARTALEDLPLYARWNPVISDRASFDPQYSDDVNRVRIMLRSDDYLLKRVGAKRVYFANKDEVLLETLADNVRASMNLNTRATSDPVAWLVKALAQSKVAKYRPLVEEVAEKAADANVRRHAVQALQGTFR